MMCSIASRQFKDVQAVYLKTSCHSTVQEIMPLNEGKIVGQGRHAELMENCAVYQEIAASQLSAEDLEKVAAQPRLKLEKGAA